NPLFTSNARLEIEIFRSEMSLSVRTSFTFRLSSFLGIVDKLIIKRKVRVSRGYCLISSFRGFKGFLIRGGRLLDILFVQLVDLPAQLLDLRIHLIFDRLDVLRCFDRLDCGLAQSSQASVTPQNLRGYFRV